VIEKLGLISTLQSSESTFLSAKTENHGCKPVDESFSKSAEQLLL